MAEDISLFPGDNSKGAFKQPLADRMRPQNCLKW